MWGFRRKPELIPVPAHGPVKLEPIQHRHIAAYASRRAHGWPESHAPFVVHYGSIAEELSDRRRWRSLGMAVVYRGTVKPKVRKTDGELWA